MDEPSGKQERVVNIGPGALVALVASVVAFRRRSAKALRLAAVGAAVEAMQQAWILRKRSRRR